MTCPKCQVKISVQGVLHIRKISSAGCVVPLARYNGVLTELVSPHRTFFLDVDCSLQGQGGKQSQQYPFYTLSWWFLLLTRRHKLSLACDSGPRSCVVFMLLTYLPTTPAFFSATSALALARVCSGTYFEDPSCLDGWVRVEAES
jgi:hypothetical protein